NLGIEIQVMKYSENIITELVTKLNIDYDYYEKQTENTSLSNISYKLINEINNYSLVKKDKKHVVILIDEIDNYLKKYTSYCKLETDTHIEYIQKIFQSQKYQLKRKFGLEW